MKKFFISLALFFLLLAQTTQAEFAVNVEAGLNVGGRDPPVLTYISSTIDTGNTTTYTFTNHAIGTAAPDRLVVVHGHVNVVAGNSLSMTIGGNAASCLTPAFTSGNTLDNLCYLLVTSGTTATIVITVPDSGGHALVDVWTITGYASSTPVDQNIDSETAGADLTVTLTTQIGDAVIAGGGSYSENPTYTWTNVTENFETPFASEAGAASGASIAATSSSTVATLNPSINANSSLIAAAWR